MNTSRKDVRPGWSGVCAAARPLLALGLCLVADAALALNECKVDFTKPDNRTWTATHHRGTTTNYNNAITRAWVQNGSNTVVIDTQGSTGVIIPHILKGNQTLQLPGGVKMVKLQCTTKRVDGTSGSFKPSITQLQSMFSNDADLLAAALKSLYGKSAGQVVAYLVGWNFSAASAAGAVESAFGDTATTMERVFTALMQAGVAAESSVSVSRNVFGPLTTQERERLVVLLKQAGEEARQTASLLKQYLDGTREQGEAWLAQAGYTTSQVADAVNATWGAVTGTGFARILSLKWKPHEGRFTDWTLQQKTGRTPPTYPFRSLRFSMNSARTGVSATYLVDRMRACAVRSGFFRQLVAEMVVDTSKGLSLPLQVSDTGGQLHWSYFAGFEKSGQIARYAVSNNRATVSIKVNPDSHDITRGVNTTLQVSAPGGGGGQLSFKVEPWTGTTDSCFYCSEFPMHGQACDTHRAKPDPSQGEAVWKVVGGYTQMYCEYVPYGAKEMARVDFKSCRGDFFRDFCTSGENCWPTRYTY